MIPTLELPIVGADRRIEVPVHDLGGAPAVRVDYAVAGAEPTEASHLWRTAGFVESPAAVLTPVQLLGSLVWIRASGRNAAGTQLSAYTDAVYVEVADHARFFSITFELDDNRTPVIRWEPAALTAGVRVSWVVHAADYDAGSWTDSTDIAAEVGMLTLSLSLEIDEAITLQVEAWDGWDSDYGMVAGESGESVTRTLIRRAVTQELDDLVLRSPDGARWRVTVSNSGELVTEVVS